MRELNTDYLGNITVGTDGKWYNGRNNLKEESIMAKAERDFIVGKVKEVIAAPSC